MNGWQLVPRRLAAVLVLAVLVLVPARPAQAALRVGDATLAVQGSEDWERENAGDPEIPRTAAGVLQLARAVWAPPGGAELASPSDGPVPAQSPGQSCSADASAAAGGEGGCGTHDLDRLYRALRNPRLDPRVIRSAQRLAAQSRPFLEKEHTTEHFYFRYTTLNADPLQNVTAAAVRDLGRNLEGDYAAYAAAFVAPRNTTTRINVYVFHSGAVSWYARTSVYTNSIEFNSRWAREACRRKVDAAHELFHRVQFVSRAKRPDWAGWEKWWTEGTAKWAEELRRPAVNDWTGWGSHPLTSPNAKEFFARSYDTVLWWVYLSQRKRLAGGDWNVPVKQVLRSYEAGKAGAALAKDVAKIGLKTTFADALRERYTANYLKDSVNPDPKYLYDDNNAAPLAPCDGGPLAKVLMNVPMPAVDGGVTIESAPLTIKAGAAVYERLDFTPGTADVVGVSFLSPDGSLADGESRLTVISEKAGVAKHVHSFSKLPIVYNFDPKGWDVDRAVVIYQSPLKSAAVKRMINPQYFDGHWTVEETWPYGFVYYAVWEIRGDTGADPSAITVTAEAANQTGVDEHVVQGTGHKNSMTVSYPCFFDCTDGGEFHFSGAVTPGTNFRELTGTMTYTYVDAVGLPAVRAGTWVATRAAW